MLKLYILLTLLLSASGNFIFPRENTDLYIDHNYSISWDNNITDYHIYLLHKENNSFISNTMSTYSNGGLVLDDLVKNNIYTWNIPRELNHYQLDNHNFKLIDVSNYLLKLSEDNNPWQGDGHFDKKSYSLISSEIYKQFNSLD